MAKIFWDKGHGGKDSGACGNGLMEKTLVHKIVEYAMAYMNATYTGFEQKTSRTGDTYLSLSERAKMANTFKADVFVSVHINAGGGHGYESYIYTQTDSKTKAFQNMLNAEIMAAMRQFGDIKPHGGDDAREANFAVVRETHMPAVLTENLYIDSSDVNYLKNEEFLKAVGEAHARGVAKFLGLKQKVVETPKEAAKSKYVVTGGLGPDGVREITEYLISKQWWAFIQFPGGGKNPYVQTGGLGPAALCEFEEWLKGKGWYYQVKE